jgi:signal transduction histidine kinase
VTSKIESALTTLRQISWELRLPVLDDFGLLADLMWYGEELAARTGIAVKVQGGELKPRPAAETEVSLFRIAQEALNNVVKHSRASEVSVTLEEGEDTLRLVIVDNGDGFDPTEIIAGNRLRGTGILNMSERAEFAGGRCAVESYPGKGTRVVTEVAR